MRYLLSVLFILVLGAAPAWASTGNQGVFTSVKGSVKVQKVGGKSRVVHKDSTVRQGDRIVTGKNSSAVVRLFDGSELSIDADSRLGFTKLEKPSVTDKILKFKLFFGKLLSKVQKLASSKSSFEVEAGGVVCGVRGTEYSMNYNPDTGKMDVVVLDGTVWASSGGQTIIYHHGEGGSFTHGHPDHQDHGDNGDHGHHVFAGSNPFYGFNGNGTDDFNNEIANLATGAGDVGGQVADNNVAGLGAYTFTLSLNFPQYSPVLP